MLLTLFYRFMPDLIYEGHVYIAMPPLYKAMPSRGEEEYLYDDKALERYRKTHKGNFTLQRYKGLGEMDAEQLWETTLNPETRILKRVEIEDARMASDVTEMLMGSDVPPRKGAASGSPRRTAPAPPAAQRCQNPRAERGRGTGYPAELPPRSGR